jgi:hypothetical protein
MPKKTLTKAETPESKIKEISTDVKKQMTIAQKIVVANQEDVVKATDFLGGVKARRKKIEELRTMFVKPLNDHVKTINAMFKEQDAPLEQIESKVKRSIADFKLEEDRKARIEEARLQKIRDEADKKREEKGQEKILTPVKTVERSEQTVSTDAGRSTAKKVWKFRVVDLDKVPRKYLRCEVAHSEVIGAINAGAREIEGLEIYEDYQVGVTAR